MTRLKLNLEVGTPKDKSVGSGEPNKECFVFYGLWRLREAGPSIRQGVLAPTANAFFMPGKGQKMTNSILPQSAVTIVNGAVRTTSLEIAKAFDKMHRNVCRDIEQIIPQVLDNSELLTFERFETTYRNNLGKDVKQRAYSLNKNAFMLLVMGFTGAKAMQIKICFINLFDRMERELIKLSQKMTQPELPLTDALPDMEKLFRVKYNGVPVVATQYLAEAFGMPRKQLYEVYRKHWKMFVDSVDVFRLKGLTGEIHKTIVDAFSLAPGGRLVNLWTASGVRKFQELLNKSFIPHKQLCCSEVSPAESRTPAEVAAAAPARKKSIFKFFLVSDVPKNLEEDTELGKLARAFAKRDPEHGGLEALAEYNALRVMAKKLLMFYDVFDKPKGWGGGAGIKDGKLVSRIML